MLENKEIMSLARRRLSGHWGKAIGSLFAFLGIEIVYAILINTPLEAILGKNLATIPDLVLQILFITPMTLGFIVFFRKLATDGCEKVNDVFQPTLDLFNANRRKIYWRNIRGLLLTIVISIAICLVCGIPTILLKAASQSEFAFVISVSIATVLFFVVFYHLTPFLAMSYYKLATDENINAIPAIKWSWNIIKGYKLKFWGLSCRFIGWWILSSIPAIIVFLWTIVNFAPVNADYTDIDSRYIVAFLLSGIILGITYLLLAPYMSVSYVIYADEIVKQNDPAVDSIPADPAA